MSLHDKILSWETIVDRYTAESDRIDALYSELVSHPVNCEEVLQHVRILESAEREKMLLASVETSTHIKWSLRAETHDGFRVWLHDYSKWSAGIATMANSVHNHRYGLLSTILFGGYIEARWRFEGDKLKPTNRSYSGGQVNVVASSEIHSLRSVDSQTLTLVLQLPKSKASSTRYLVDPEGNYSSHELIDLTARLSRLGDF